MNNVDLVIFVPNARHYIHICWLSSILNTWWAKKRTILKVYNY